ncbi:PKD domain-containing protein, partial [Putridiphycobacter roseus]
NQGTLFTDLTTIAGTSSIDSIHWNFGDNTFGVDSIENHIYNNIGTYSVQLFAQSDQGCADSLVQTVFVNPNPVVDFSLADTCVFQVVNLNNNSSITSGTISNYEWDFGDNSTSTLFEPNHAFNQAVNYALQLVAISDSACTDTSTLSLTIHPQPVADFTFTSSCFNASFIDASNIASGGINDYAWNFGDMGTASIQNPNHIYTANGNYTVNLQTTSDFGCVHDTSKSINIFNNFTADFILSNSQICSGDCIQFSDSSTAHTSGT